VKCIDAGCTDYLPKPLTRFQLLRMAARFGRTSGASPEQAQSAIEKLASAPSSAPAGRIRSEMTSEPRLAKLLEKFVERLPERVAVISSSLQERNLNELRQAVHQLKGAGGGYGFPQITESAGRAEEQIKAEADLESIRSHVESLIELVRNVEGYDPSKESKPAMAATSEK